MSIAFTPLKPGVGMQVTGIDLRQPITPEDQTVLSAAIDEHAILLFRDQHLTPEQQVAFSRPFGDLNIHVHQRMVTGMPEIIVLSNLIEDGKPVGSANCALSWHTDGTHLEKPVSISILHCVVAPEEGGETQFADTRRAYDTLPTDTRAFIDGKKAIHSYALLQQRSFPDRPLSEEKKRAIPDRAQPIAFPHPRTGRKALYLGQHVIKGVVGMPDDEGVELVASLVRHATQDEFVYCHKWQPGDLMMWDNYGTLHRATYLDVDRQRRRLHRTTVNGEVVTGDVVGG